MVVDPYINTAIFSIALIAGGLFGRHLANMGTPFESGGGRPQFSSPSNETEQRQLFVNTGVLYATVILVVGTVVSEWPPEGQQFPEFLSDFVFFGSTFITAAIFVRIGLLIYRVESDQHLTQ